MFCFIRFQKYKNKISYSSETILNFCISNNSRCASQLYLTFSMISFNILLRSDFKCKIPGENVNIFKNQLYWVIPYGQQSSCSKGRDLGSVCRLLTQHVWISRLDPSTTFKPGLVPNFITQHLEARDKSSEIKVIFNYLVSFVPACTTSNPISKIKNKIHPSIIGE